MKNILTAATAATLLSCSAVAADINASIDVEVAKNNATDKFEAETTLNLDVKSGTGLAFGAISFQSAGNTSVAVDEWHVGTVVAGTQVSFGDQGGVLPEANAATGFDTLADTNAAMTESLQVSTRGFDLALGMSDVRTDVTEVSNIQASYTTGLSFGSVTGAVDYNRTSEEYTYAVAGDTTVSGLGVGGIATYAADKWAYEVDTTVGNLTAYLNGDENDSLQHVGVSTTTQVAGLDLTGTVDYDTDNSEVSPSVKLSFNF